MTSSHQRRFIRILSDMRESMLKSKQLLKEGAAICLATLLVFGRLLSAGAAENSQKREIHKEGESELPNDREVANQKILSPVMGYALLTTGGVLLLTSIVTGSLALKMNSDLKDKCPDGRCYEPHHREVDRLEALATVTDAFIPLCAALFVAGTFSLVMSKKTERKYGKKNRSQARAPYAHTPYLDRLELTSNSIVWRF